jgi:3-phenylpropionate/trans-cinnamate dioxygenase ferredoxin subunit
MARHVVAAVDEIPPGARRCVEAGGKRIVVFNLGGAFFALGNRCPHQGGPLSEGPVMGLVESAGPGEYRYDRAGEIVRCPWHAWEFDIRSGRSRVDPRRTKVRAYPAQVESGAALQAETFAVRVEASYVVVEV